MKKYTTLLVLGVLLLGAAVYAVATQVDFNRMLLAAGYYEKRITIINTADLHGHITFKEYDTGGLLPGTDQHPEMGMALIKGIADEIRKDNPHTLMLDGGDMFHGTPEAAVNEGEGILEIANLMGYDALTAGNHEFDWGWERTMELKDKLNFPILSANITKGGQPVFEAYRIFEVGGKRIGVFGLTTAQFLQDLQVHGIGDVRYEDPLPAAQKAVAELREQQVDSIILLSHLGDDLDRHLIAANVSGIDLILSAHGHFLYEKPLIASGVPVVESGGYSTHVGVADLYFRQGKVAKVAWGVRKTLDRKKEDPKIAEIVGRYHAMALENGKEVVATSESGLDGIRSHVRTKSTNLGNLVADAMRVRGNADLTLYNSGGIRESIPGGDVTLYKLDNVLPFVNNLVTVELKGEAIYKALEHGMINWPSGASNGGFLQVSGITYEIDGSKPAGKRLSSVTRNGQPLDKNAMYKVAITDFLIAGGDDHDVFKDAKVVQRGGLLSQEVAAYLKSQGGKLPEELEEERIKIINQRYQ
ncbi:bifunctional metallophosphatase/5'-nucleotidase [Paenibacillus puerhi]|uniref:bifunctional metallophosphatase/5'-nucleotidase n=1 Tax=Paenibacillus puerhi TaxID=2692622 RepID=UPI0013584308|nr:bifunctional UDP-sugar hydrolase/5'-nucleotidase [Paenibacillus puerhi]